MPYHRFKTPIYVEDARGHCRALKGCSLNDLPALYNLLELIVIRLSESQFETLSELWVGDLFWRELVNEALRLVGLKSEWFTPSNLAELLLPQQDEQGNVIQGLIAQVCFPSPAPQAIDTSDRLSLEQYRIQQLLNLVNTGMARDLKEAIELSDRLNNEEVDEIISRLDEARQKTADAQKPGKIKAPPEMQAILKRLQDDPSELFRMPKNPELVKTLV